MTREEMKQVLREQQVGYDILRQFNIEEARKATFEDRLRGFVQIMDFSEHLPIKGSQEEDGEVASRWKLIKDNYAKLNRE